MPGTLRSARWHLRAGRRRQVIAKGQCAHVPISRYVPGEARRRHCASRR